MTWQQDRASKLGLNIINQNYVAFKKPRQLSVNFPFTRTHLTIGDGNCFFRAVSMYLTGTDDSHGSLRRMVTEHVQYNQEQFMAYSAKTEDQLKIYLENMKRTSGTKKSVDCHWADDLIITATSSFLKTSIVIWTPQIVGNITQCVWYTCDGTTVGETAYENNIFFNYTPKQIILNNESGDHFEPADFEND